MKDLIERQSAIDAIGALSDAVFKNIEKGATYPKGQWFDGMANAESIIKNLPSAQQEIIYCKDCSRYSNGYCHHPETYGMYVDANHFCGYAERMGDE